MSIKRNLRRASNYYHISGSISDTARRIFLELSSPRREVMPLPVSALIETTTVCNFRCVICAREKLSAERKNMYLTGEKFTKLLDAIPTLKRISFLGFGEPFLTPSLQDLLDIGRKRKIRMTTVTNGSLLHMDSVLKIALQFDELIVSFDGIDKKTFESIRVGANFDKIIEGMKKFDELRRKQSKRPIFRLHFAASHLNYNEIPKLKEIAMDVGVDSLAISEMTNWYIPSEPEYAAAAEFNKKTIAISKEIKEKAQELTMSLKPFGKPVVYVGQEKIKPVCRWMFNNIFISADGYVTPCCKRLNPEVFNFGNIYKENFAEIWNGKACRDFRRTMIEDTPNPVCDTCPN